MRVYSTHYDYSAPLNVVSLINMGMTKDEALLFIVWLKADRKSLDTLNQQIPRFKFALELLNDDSYNLIVARKRWFDRLWSKIKK